MSRYDHKIETSLEGIEHLSKEKKEEKENRCSKTDSISVNKTKTLLPPGKDSLIESSNRRSTNTIKHKDKPIKGKDS